MWIWREVERIFWKTSHTTQTNLLIKFCTDPTCPGKVQFFLFGGSIYVGHLDDHIGNHESVSFRGPVDARRIIIVGLKDRIDDIDPWKDVDSSCRTNLKIYTIANSLLVNRNADVHVPAPNTIQTMKKSILPVIKCRIFSLSYIQAFIVNTESCITQGYHSVPYLFD